MCFLYDKPCKHCERASDLADKIERHCFFSIVQPYSKWSSDSNMAYIREYTAPTPGSEIGTQGKGTLNKRSLTSLDGRLRERHSKM